MKPSRAIPGPIGLAPACAAAVLAAALAAAALGSCIDDGTALCASRLRCPPGFSCTLDGSGCTSSLCGNGTMDDGERCDDGNVTAGDGCNANCTSDERCGNGILDPGEHCDRMSSAVPCDLQCRRPCGNTQLDPGEECDGKLFRVTCVDIGFDRGAAGCSAITCVALKSQCAHIGWRRDSRMEDGLGSVAIGDLFGVWGANDGQIFAVGTDVSGAVVMILRFDGQAWSIDRQGPHPGTLLDIWGSGSQDVFAVGEGGRVLHRDESGAWLALNTGVQAALRGVWGDGRDGDVIAVGDEGTIVRLVRSSGQWVHERPRDIATDPVFEAVWGRDGRDGGEEMWAVGRGGVIVRYSQREWVREAEGLTGADLLAVWGSEDSEGTDQDGDVFAVGADGTILRRDEETDEWSIMSGPQGDLHALWGSGHDSVFAVGERGATLFWDGEAWRTLLAGTDLTIEDLWRVPGYGLVGVAANGAIFRLDGWSWMPLSSPATEDSMRSLWARGLDEVYGVFDGHPYLRRFDGGAWQDLDLDALLPPTSGGPGPLRSVWGTPEGDLYAVGDDRLVLRYRPATGWERMSIPQAIPASHFFQAWSGNGELFVVGQLAEQNDGIILRHDGVSWRQLAKPGPTVLRGVWGVSADGQNEVFAVGTGGLILRYDGNAEGTLEPMESNTLENLNAIWGNSRENVHVVGDNGVALTYNGFGWELSTNITDEHLYSVWGSGTDHVFAIGSGSSLLHRNRHAWSPVTQDTDQPLASITGVDGPRGRHRVVIFGGEAGVFRRFLVNDDANSAF